MLHTPFAYNQLSVLAHLLDEELWMEMQVLETIVIVLVRFHTP